MPRKKIVAGNWKMNKTLQEAEALVKAVVAGCDENNSVTKIFFPSFVFIHGVSSLIKERKDFFVGAQNCHQLESGAYTGEVSARALASAGATHVIIGHS